MVFFFAATRRVKSNGKPPFSLEDRVNSTAPRSPPHFSATFSLPSEDRVDSEESAPRSPSFSHVDQAVHYHVAGDFASQRLSRSPSPKRAVNRPAVTPPSIRDAPRCIEEKPTPPQGRRCRRTSSTMRRLPLRRRDLSRMFPRPRHDPGGITELSTCPSVTTADMPHGPRFYGCCDVSAEVRSPPLSHHCEHAVVLASLANSDVAKPKLVVEASMHVYRKTAKPRQFRGGFCCRSSAAMQSPPRLRRRPRPAAGSAPRRRRRRIQKLQRNPTQKKVLYEAEVVFYIILHLKNKIK